jgi:hypothetical protein
MGTGKARPGKPGSSQWPPWKMRTRSQMRPTTKMGRTSEMPTTRMATRTTPMAPTATMRLGIGRSDREDGSQNPGQGRPRRFHPMGHLCSGGQC